MLFFVVKQPEKRVIAVCLTFLSRIKTFRLRTARIASLQSLVVQGKPSPTFRRQLLTILQASRGRAGGLRDGHLSLTAGL